MNEKIKLVIWDLDETFWNGTLSEEGVLSVPANINIVKELSSRGIISSISSKNDFDLAREKLEELDVWDYFVFRKINWNPKGLQVKETIEDMGLRPVNVLFIDDNLMNLNEVKSACPEISVYHPNDILHQLLEMPQLQGKIDNELSRLNQYKSLEKKIGIKKTSNLTNVDFLKDSDIEVYFDYECENNLERVFELIERTNQLNYTKNRIDSEKKKNDFLRILGHYQSSSALIYCRDKYGDYGIVGFYLMRTCTEMGKSLEHFVFSCRTMNMGVENYVYNTLGRPKISISNPVAYGLDEYKNIDWIKRLNTLDTKSNNKVEVTEKIVTLGPCHLLQMTNFFSDSQDFVHYQTKYGLVKYDCPGFFLNKLESLEKHEPELPNPCWDISSFKEFHSAIENADKLVLSIDDLLLDYNLIEINDLIFRGESKNDNREDFIDINKKVELINKCIEYVGGKTKSSCKIFILDSLYNIKTERKIRDRRLAFSRLISNIDSKKVTVLNVNGYADTNEFNDGLHLSRTGYYKLAQSILNEDFDVICDFDYNNFIIRPKGIGIIKDYAKEKALLLLSRFPNLHRKITDFKIKYGF